MKRRATIVALFFVAFGVAQPVWACATCFGEADHPQTQGMNMAIITMMGVTYTLLGGMAGSVFLVIRNARRLQAENSEDLESSHG